MECLEAFKKSGVISNKEEKALYEKFLTTFERTKGNQKFISLNKILTSVLLLSKDQLEDKINYLFGIYESQRIFDEILTKASFKQMQDHVYFCVIYAIPNLAYYSLISSFGENTSKCDRVMEIKLEMQKKVNISWTYIH